MSKKADEEQALAKILDYMETQNRPYSPIDVTTNLRKEFGKTLVVKSLESLAQSGELKEKTIGKQKIYYANQDALEAVDEAELGRLDTEVAALAESVGRRRDELKAIEAEARGFSAALPTHELIAKAESLRREAESVSAAVVAARAAAADLSPAESERVQERRNAAVFEWRRRKRMASQMLDQILENYPKKPKQLYEDIGIETDEDCNSKMPAM